MLSMDAAPCAMGASVLPSTAAASACRVEVRPFMNPPCWVCVAASPLPRLQGVYIKTRTIRI
jgi:hypothetical protein